MGNVANGIELFLGEAAQFFLFQATLAKQSGEEKGQDRAAQIEGTVDAPALRRASLPFPKRPEASLIRSALSFPSRITAFSWRLRTTSKARRPIIFSAGDHFQWLLGAVAMASGLAMLLVAYNLEARTWRNGHLLSTGYLFLVNPNDVMLKSRCSVGAALPLATRHRLWIPLASDVTSDVKVR